jgi:hypothetical protein
MTQEVINAFHPDYVKTHMPDFLKSLRSNNIKEEAGKNVSKYVEKTRETKPSHGTLFGISEKSASVAPKQMMRHKNGRAMTMADIHNDLADKLKIKDFHIYAKAGAPKEKK